MRVRLTLEPDQYKKILKFIEDQKYENVHQFIRIAIANQLQDEGSYLEHPEIDIEIADDLPENKEKVAEHYDLKSEKVIGELEEDLENWTAVKSEIKKSPEDLIWSFYNRFFPVKIIIIQLASMISREESWIDLEELRETALVSAQDWCKALKDYELDKQIPRNKKISVGLPIHPNELKKLTRKRERTKMQNKIESSKKRFVNQIVGKYSKKDQSFYGSCFSMGLMAVKLSGTKVLVSLTELGKKFALIKNPLINQQKFENAFSVEETKFIYKNIIPEFKLEQQITKNVIDELFNKGTLDSKKINTIFEEYKKQIFEFYSNDPDNLDEEKKNPIIVQARVATMGRLSEIGMVEWEIDNSGLSHYRTTVHTMNFGM